MELSFLRIRYQQAEFHARMIDTRHRDQGKLMHHEFTKPRGLNFVHLCNQMTCSYSSTSAYPSEDRQPWLSARGQHLDHL